MPSKRVEKASHVEMIDQNGLFLVPQSPLINWLFCSVGHRLLKTFLLRPTSPKIILPNVEQKKKGPVGKYYIFS